MSKKKTLADLMDNDFFIDFDNTEEKAKRKQLAESLKIKPALTESAEDNVKEPDNAVVDCKVNKVIAHCEDEKPVDCLGEKKPLEKPLTEDTDVVRMAAWCARNCQDFYKAIITNSSYKKLGRAAYKALKERYGIDGEEAEDVMCKGYVIWKQRHWDGTNESLNEARSSADIKAEIERLQKELADAEVAEKKAGYNGNVPTEVWIWDIYLKPSKKGTWTSAELYQGKYDGYVYETEEDALDGAWVHLGELDDEGELRGDPDDYYVEAFSVPVSEVHEETLSYSGLDHLI